MTTAKKAKKRERFTRVQKRSTYNEMKQSDDKAKTFAIMLKNNPKVLKYFTKKNVFERTPELVKIIFLTEQYAKKEHLRSAEYPIIEAYKNDKKFRNASAQKEIKKLIQDTIMYCKSTNSDEYKAVLKVLENVNKKEIDTDKIYHDKEWYRPLVRTLGAMGIGAYLMGRAFWAVPETQPELIVEQVQMEDDTCEKSLDLCLGALNGLDIPPKVVTRKVEVTKMPNKNEYCKEFISALNAVPVSVEFDQNLINEIDELRKQLDKANIRDQNLKYLLLKKLDSKFSRMDEEGVKKHYPLYRKKWEKRLEENEAAAFVTLIKMGDYIMEPYIQRGVVESLHGHLSEMPNGRRADIARAIRRRNIIYVDGIWSKNNMPGVAKSMMGIYEGHYVHYKNIYGNSKWNHKIE